MSSKPIKRGNYYYLYDRSRGKGKEWQKLSQNLTIAKKAKIKYDNDKENSRLGLPMQDVYWNDFCKKYLEYAKINKRPKTYKGDKLTIQAFNEYANITYVNELTAELLESWKAHLTKTLKISSVNKYITRIKTMGSRIEDWYKIDNPLKSVKKIRTVRKATVRFFTDNELKTLFAYLNNGAVPYYRTASMIALYQGLRIGEVCHLRWSDINFDLKEMSITAKPEVDWQPKNGRERTNPMPPKLSKYLYDLFQKAKNKDDWVLKSNGEIVNEESLSITYTRLLKRLNIQNAKFHTLRKTCATKLGESGVSVRALMDYLGHESIGSILKYFGVTEVYMKAMVTSINFKNV